MNGRLLALFFVAPSVVVALAAEPFLLRAGSSGPRLTCAEVERVLPAMAESNGGALGAVACKRVHRIDGGTYVVDAELVQGSEVRLWTFQVVANGWLVTHAEQTGSRVAKPPPA